MPTPHRSRRVASNLWWGTLIVASIPLAVGLERRLAVAGTVLGTESAEVDRRLGEDFRSPFRSTAVLVTSGWSIDPASDSGRAVMRRLVEPLSASRLITGVISSGTSLDTMLVGVDRATAIALVGLDPSERGAVDSLRALVRSAAEPVRAAHPRLTARVTGQPALLDDLRSAGSRAARRAELVALPVTVLVAVWAFGSVGLLARALTAAAITTAVGLGVAGLVSFWLPVSPLARTASGLVGVALAIDYVLFRVRALGARTGRTVWLAATTVAIGYLALAIAPSGELRAAALVGVGAAVTAAAIAIRVTAGAGAEVVPFGSGDRWVRWGRWVVRHPWRVVALGGTPLVALALAAARAKLVTPLERWLPEEAESTIALTDLDRAGRVAAIGTLRVLVELPETTPVLSPAGWAAVRVAGERLGRMPGAAGVRSVATIGTGELVVARDVFPKAVTDALVSADRRAAVIDLLPDPAVPRDSVTALVRRIRSTDPGALTGVAGSRLAVGGLPAYALDYQRAIGGTLPAIVVAIATVTFLALLIGLGAPVIALKAVGLNLLVATAAVGATVLVFQDGFGVGLLGHQALGSLLPTVPVVAFATTFGVSMDYELFLVAAVADARTTSRSEAEAIAVGLARSGPVITRAAAVMGSLFLATAASDLVPLAMVGFTLGVAVLLDATVVRLALAPAILRLAARWNWWPRSGGKFA